MTIKMFEMSRILKVMKTILLEPEKYTEEELKDPQENIRIGIQYIDYLYSRFDSLPEVLAAYNGGPNNVKKWVARRPNNSTAKFIEEIPFPETRIFVKRVIRSYNMYMEIYGTESSL